MSPGKIDQDKALKGIYCLIVKVMKDSYTVIGALGPLLISKGTYVYVGSAQNNLEKRVTRHMSPVKKMRWHIDFLLAHPDAVIEKVLYLTAGREYECLTARMLSTHGSPVMNFGCSDCSCKSHLYKVKSVRYLITRGFRNLEFPVE